MAGFIVQNIADGRLRQFYPEDVDTLPRDGSITILDVRTVEEYELGHAEGSCHIPVDELRERISEIDLTKPLYVICQSGLRSYLACCILSQHDADCYNLSGGFRFYQTVIREQTAAKTALPCGLEQKK